MAHRVDFAWSGEQRSDRQLVEDQEHDRSLGLDRYDRLNFAGAQNLLYSRSQEEDRGERSA